MTSAAIRKASYESLADDSVPSDSVPSDSTTALGSNTDLNARIVALLAAYPGIKTLTALVAIDPNELTQGARIDYLSALERQSAWLQAVMQRAIVAVAGSDPSTPEKPWDGIDDAEREDVAAALRLSGSTAQMRIDVARTL